jgi:hypothetical protein
MSGQWSVVRKRKSHTGQLALLVLEFPSEWLAGLPVHASATPATSCGW